MSAAGEPEQMTPTEEVRQHEKTFLVRQPGCAIGDLAGLDGCERKWGTSGERKPPQRRFWGADYFQRVRRAVAVRVQPVQPDRRYIVGRVRLRAANVRRHPRKREDDALVGYLLPLERWQQSAHFHGPQGCQVLQWVSLDTRRRRLYVRPVEEVPRDGPELDLERLAERCPARRQRCPHVQSASGALFLLCR